MIGRRRTTDIAAEPRRSRLLNVKEAGELLHVSEWTVRELCWSGRLPHVRVGRKVLVNLVDLEDFIRQNTKRAGY